MRRLLSLLRNIFRKNTVEEALDEEVRQSVEILAEEKAREGLTPPEARRQAIIELGGTEQVKERVRQVRAGAMLEQLFQDIRFSLRVMLKNPGFTLVASLTLALGIGANTAIFSVIDTVLLKPLPYPDPERLVKLYQRIESGETESISPADFLDIRSQARSFERIAAFRELSFNLTGQERPERVRGAVVTPDFFAILGIPARLGRSLMAERDKPGGARTVVISHTLWQRQYGGDREILGKSIGIDGEPRTVVGVMPEGFRFPDSELWVPSRYAAPEQPLAPKRDNSTSRDSHYFDVIGRLNRGVSLTRARAETDTIFRVLKKQYGDDEEGVGAAIVTLHEDLVGETRQALLILTGAVAMLLLIACANVANILLARGASRQREIALRGALGAGRNRLIRQILTESLLLAGAGGGLGIALAYWALAPLRALIPSEVVAGAALKPDARLLVFTAAASFAAALIFGLIPATHLTNPGLESALKEGGRGSAHGSRALRTRSLLVVSEIGLAFALLIGAGLLIRSFSRLLAVPEGFDPERVLSMQLSLPQARYPGEAERARFVARVLDRAAVLPGVVSAAVTSRLPLNPGRSTRSIDILGRTPTTAGDIAPDYLVISPDYFRSMGIPLLAGRFFTARDNSTSPTVAIVSEAAARHFWPGEDPIGKMIQIGVQKDWSPVVGVVGDVRQHHLDQASPLAVYLPYAQDPWPFMALVVRTGTEPAAAASAVEAAVHAVDHDEPVYGVRTMRDVVAASLSSQRSRMVLLGMLAFLALALACLGIYGVMSYSVAQRTHEMGIRIALGASSRNVLGLVVGHAMKLTLAGIAAGLALSITTAQLMSGLVYGVRTVDIATYAGVSVILAAVALVASYIPARRTLKVDPVTALRAE